MAPLPPKMPKVALNSYGTFMVLTLTRKPSIHYSIRIGIVLR